MIVRTYTALFIILLVLLSCQPAVEAPTEGSGLVVSNAWARAIPPGRTMTAAYAEFKNTGSTILKINEFYSPQFSSVSLHETIIDSHGMSHMQELHGLVLQPGESVVLEPGGKHLMLMGLHLDQSNLESCSITIQFALEKPVKVEFVLK